MLTWGSYIYDILKQEKLKDTKGVIRSWKSKDSIVVIFGGRVFQQTIGIPMGTNCVPLLTDLFLYSYEADFTQGLLRKTEKKLPDPLISHSANIDDVLLLNNCRFGDFVDRINPIKLEIKDTTDTDRSASYLDLKLQIDS